MISIFLTISGQAQREKLSTDSRVIYLQKPDRELLENEFYSDLDALKFSQADFDIFISELKAKSLFDGDSINFNVLANEERKYIFIRIFNLTQLINSIVGESEFKLHFDRKVLKFPSLTVLLGDNKESPKVFLHDLRDTVYPCVIAFYGEKRCVYLKKKLDFNLYIRSILLFFITSARCFMRTLLLCVNSSKVPKYKEKEKEKEKDKKSCFVFVRGNQQLKFLERIASNSIMQDVNFLIFSENQKPQSFNFVDNICFMRLSRKIYVSRLLVVFFKSLYTLLKAVFSPNSLNKNRSLELLTNLEHLYWQDINSLILDKGKINDIPLISFEMVGRHSRIIQDLCRAKKIRLHRFQVASIEPRHLEQISSYGRFWILDKLTYQQLKKRFTSEISFDRYILPKLNLDKLQYAPSRIMFATQPYGEEDNYKIIENLLKLTGSSYQVVIRKHPRDNIDYKKRFPTVEYDNMSDAIESIACSGIVVSKTSTILQDCYNLGVPYIAVLFDDFSRTLDLLFTKIEGCYCIGEKDFKLLIKAYMEQTVYNRSPVFNEPSPLKKIKEELLFEII